MRNSQAVFEFVFGPHWDRYAHIAGMAEGHRDRAEVMAGTRYINDQAHFGLMRLPLTHGAFEQGLGRFEALALRLLAHAERVYLLAVYAGQVPLFELRAWSKLLHFPFEEDEKPEAAKQKTLLSPREMRISAKGVMDHEAGKALARGFTLRRVRLFESGEALRLLRLQLGLSAAQLARLCQTAPQAIHAWEQDQRQIDGNSVLLLRMMEANPEIIAWMAALAGTREPKGRERPQ